MTLTLYRGDAEKIKEFELKKTNKFCLLGQGIYLTDNLKVANSYRTKGGGVSKHQLFYGPADNRTQALEMAFEKFCAVKWASENRCFSYGYTRLTPAEQKKCEDKYRGLYRQLVEAKEITAEYTTAPVTTVIRGGTIKPSATIAWQKELDKKHKKYLKVEWEEIPDAGYVTKFEFAPEKFDPFVFNVDKACNDDFFWTLMYEEKLMIGAHYATSLEEYIRLNKGRKVFDAVHIPPPPPGTRVTTKQRIARYDSKAMWRKIANIIKPYGFVGYEYNGGQRLGGGYHHRAFSMWDEDFVNDHKVLRFK